MKKDYQIILLEEIRDQNKALLEGQKEQVTRADFHRLEGKVDDLSQRMGVVEAAVKDVSRDLANHKSLPVHVAHGRA